MKNIGMRLEERTLNELKEWGLKKGYHKYQQIIEGLLKEVNKW